MRVQEKDLHPRDLIYHFEEVSLYRFCDIHVVLCPVGWMIRVEKEQVENMRGEDQVGSLEVTNNKYSERLRHNIPTPSGHRRTHKRHPKTPAVVSSHRVKRRPIFIMNTSQQQYCVASFLLLLNNLSFLSNPP